MRNRKAPVEEVVMEEKDSETDVSDEEDEGMEVELGEENASHPAVVDEEGAEELEVDIDALVNKTLQRFSTSKFHSKSSACSALHSQLISSGKLREKKIIAAKGIIEKQTWRGGKTFHPLLVWRLRVLILLKTSTTLNSNNLEISTQILILLHLMILFVSSLTISTTFVKITGNAVEEAQSESALYDSKEQLAAPLKAAKVVRPETVGKGWFDFQVVALIRNIELLCHSLL